ncbi:MAG: hypothetical protein CMF27_01575 [Kiritimatiellaceae bacterium]|jgi:hypothetical protein|nr:hypothetical protein [Kiritimatiellaceae bacterium]|tara:strand:- start:13 stop:249 length:237 start_codon:yes stop_codon:yes gene_type:complete
MIFINSSPVFFAIWMILGIISYLLHPKIKEELGSCLKTGKFFHLFGGILYGLFLAFLFGPLSYLLIALAIKIVNRAKR